VAGSVAIGMASSNTTTHEGALENATRTGTPDL